MNNRRYSSDRPSSDRYQDRFRDRYDDSRYDNYQSRSSEDRDWHGYNNADAAENRRGQRQEDRYASNRDHSYFLENRNPAFQSDFNDFDSSSDRGSMSRDRGMGRGMDRGYDRADYSSSQYSAYGSDDYRRNASDTMDDWGTRREWNRRDNRSRDYDHNDSRSGGFMNAVKSFFGKGPKGYKRSDERIKEDISEALYRHPRIDASDIDVDVKEGNVTLQGTVDSREVKRMAEDLIEECIGVVNVSNHLRVAQSSYGLDSSMRSGSSQNISGQSTGESLSTDKKGKALQ